MKIFIVLIGLVLASQAHQADNSVDLNTVAVCATLNNVYRTFSNILEVYSEFKATGQLWVPVAIHACRVTYTDCPTFTPVCAVSSDNVYKTFTNKCVLEAEQKATGIAWNVVFDGVCSANSADGSPPANSLVSTPAGNHNQALQMPHFPSSSHAENCSSVNNEESVQPFINRELNQNSLQAPLSSNTNQAATQAPAEKDSLTSQSSSPYDDSSLPNPEHYNTVQQPQPLPHLPEPIQPFANGQVYQTTERSVNSPHYENSHNIQAGESSVLPHPLSPYVGFSLPATGQYNSVQKPQSVSNFPESIESSSNLSLSENSTPNAEQNHADQASVPAHLSPSYDGSSLPATGLHNSAQQPQSTPNYNQPIIPIAIAQVHQNLAQLSPSSLGASLSGNSPQITVPAQVNEASSASHVPSYYNVPLVPSTIQYNSIQQPPASNHSNVHQNLAQSSSSIEYAPLSGSSNQVGVQAQAETVSLPSQSSFANDGSSLPTSGQHKLVQSLPHYPEPIQPAINDQAHQSLAKLETISVSSSSAENSHQIVEPAQIEQATLSSHPSPSYEDASSSLPTTEQHNSAQQPQHISNNSESVQPLTAGEHHSQPLLHYPVADDQVHQGLAQFATISLNSSLSENGSEILDQLQADQAALFSHSLPSNDSSSLHTTVHHNSAQQPQPIPYSESIQPLASAESEQQSQPLPHYPEPIKLTTNDPGQQSSAPSETISVNPSLSESSNQISEQAQAEQASLSTEPPLSYDDTTFPTTEQNNSAQPPQHIPNNSESIQTLASDECDQQSQPLPHYPEPIQPATNDQVHQSSAQSETNSVNPSLSENSNQISEQAQAEQAPLSTDQPLSYDGSSMSTTEPNNSDQPPQHIPNHSESIQPLASDDCEQQSQPLPHYPEPIQPAMNDQVHHSSAPSETISVNPSLSENSNQISEQAQAEQAPLSTDQPLSYDGSSMSTTEPNNSDQPPQHIPNHSESIQPLASDECEQQSQPLPHYPEPIQPATNDQVHQSSAPSETISVNPSLSENSNQISEQAQAEHALLSTYPPISYDGSSMSTTEPNNSDQPPQHIPNHSESIQPLASDDCEQQSQPLPHYPEPIQPAMNDQVHHSSAPSETISVNPSLSENSNQISEQAPLSTDQPLSYDESTLPMTEQHNSAQQPQHIPNNSESVQPLASAECEQQSQPLPHYPEPIQPATNDQVHQSSEPSETISVNPSLSESSNQISEQAQAEQASLSTEPPLSYDDSTLPTTEPNNSAQQPQYVPNNSESVQPLASDECEQQSQPLPHYPEPIQPATNDQVHQSSEPSETISVNPSLSESSNQISEQAQAEQASLSTEPTLSYDDSTLPTTEPNNSDQQPQHISNNSESIQPLASDECEQQTQPLPHYPEPIQPATNDQVHQSSTQSETYSMNTSLSENSNQISEQAQVEQASLPTDPPLSYDESSFSTTGQHNSAQQPQHIPNNSESNQPIASGQVHLNSVQLSSSIGYPPPSVNSNQIGVENQDEPVLLASQSSFSNDDSSLPISSQYNSVQQPHDAEPTQPATSDLVPNSSAQFATIPLSENSNQIAEQSQIHQPSLSSNPSLSYDASSLYVTGQHNSFQQPQHMENHSESSQPIASGQAHQNSVSSSSSIGYPQLSENSKQVGEQAQDGQAILASNSAWSNDNSTQPTSGGPDAGLQSLSLTQYPEPIQPFMNDQVHQTSASMEDSNVIGLHTQAEIASLESLSSLPNDNSSLPPTDHNNLVHHRHPLPPYAVANSDQVYQNPEQLATISVNSPLSGYSNQSVEHAQTDQPQTEQASLGSHSESCSDSSSLPPEGQSSSDQMSSLDQEPKSATEPIQPIENGQSDQISAPLADSSISSNGNGVEAQSQARQAVSEATHSSHSEPTLVQPISFPILTNYDHSAVLPVPTSQLGSAEANAEPQSEANSCGQSSGTADGAGLGNTPDMEPCSNAQTFKSPELESQPLPTNAPISDDVSVNSESNQNHNSNQQPEAANGQMHFNSHTAKPKEENSHPNAQNEGQTVYNGVVYQGPYYYEPKYKHIYFGSFNLASAPGSALASLANGESTLSSANDNAAITGQQHNTIPLEQLLRQLKHVSSSNE